MPGRIPSLLIPRVTCGSTSQLTTSSGTGASTIGRANDGGRFAHAVLMVKAWGGVLEHPAGSNAWARYALPRPVEGAWTTDGGFWVCEVWQSAYGHKARKRTWLLYRGPKPPDPDWRREPGTHQCGWFDRIKPTLSKKEASRTPQAFADYLVSLARLAG